jgi:hypothetical protein
LRLGTKASLLLTKEAAKSANEILTSSCCSRVISANIGSDKNAALLAVCACAVNCSSGALFKKANFFYLKKFYRVNGFGRALSSCL